MPLPRRETAPAKLNLSLHVTGCRADGYHLLDSLVVFLELGDVVTVAPGPLSLSLTGPFAQGLAAEPDNLCLRAARLAGREARITLEKNLPVASGIGGGSSDADASGLERLAKRVEVSGGELPQLVEELSRFILPLFEAVHGGPELDAWAAGGPWRTR